jgi:hypothetical protein
MTTPDLIAYLGELRARAARKLDYQAARAAMFQAYYDGEEDIVALLDTDERRTFQRFLRESGANWIELVVNAVAERLTVTGFRFQGADEDAWAIWQASQMDADAELAQTDALITGSCPVLVQPDADNPTGVAITVESPQQATVLYEPGSARRRIAGYKRFTEEEDHGQDWEVLITPDVIATWEPDEPDPVIEGNPAGEVGMIEVIPQPRTGRPPRSEIKSAVPIQDRINTTIFARMVGVDYGAFRQIWATGVKLARKVISEDENGQQVRLVAPFNVGANRLLVSENPDARIGSIAEGSLAGYLSAVEQDVNMMAAITQTPPHYLLGQIANLSADAITAAEAGLVAKVSRRSRHVGEDWEEVIRTAFRMTGNPAAADIAAETIWADFETRSLAQLADALLKLGNLSVPTEVLWEKWGATQQEVRRWRTLAAQEDAARATASSAMLGAPDAAYARLLAAGGTAPAGPPATTPTGAPSA